ncbi:FG-GAP repeat domain-containing protein [Agromyces bracchium]|nr:VCBS repeat-containing protein [Agromyces bracchium]
MLSDGLNLDQPQYYETIQAGRRVFCKTRQNADIDGDGQDELIYRGPAGISAFRFDADTGQWLALPPSTVFGDEAGWDEEWYYTTIQTADLDGDGRAELIGWGPKGVEVHRYDPATETWTDLGVTNPMTGLLWAFPWYFSTMQCADIDGDGQDELLVRYTDGLRAWKLTGTSWTQLTTISAMSDGAGWIDPSMFETIQCADLDGDGRAEVFARSADGIVAWRYSAGQWVALPAGPGLSNAEEWNYPQYYRTLQAADLDGDGRAEIFIRNNTQIRAWKFTGTGWQELPPGPMMEDSDGWANPQYYVTLQAADLDGDGRAEILVRSGYEILAWKYTDTGWQFLPIGPAWSDADGWNASQYYRTIQPARVKTSAAANPHMPATESGTVDVLFGRSSMSIETFRMLPEASWAPTSAPWPTLDPAAYAYAAELLGIPGKNVRDIYGNSDDLSTYEEQLHPTPALPAGSTIDPAQWAAVCEQLTTELNWADQVNTWYDNVNSLLTATYTGDDIALQAVGNTIKLTNPSSTSLTLSILSFVANVAAAGLSLTATPMAGAVAGIIGAACTLAGSTSGSDSDQVQDTIANLDQQLIDAFESSLLSMDAQKAAATRDYGLLAAIGGQIISQAPAWTWNSTDRDTLMIAGQRQYAMSAWKALAATAGWKWSVCGRDEPLGAPDLLEVNGELYYDNGWFWLTNGYVPWPASNDDDLSVLCAFYMLRQGVTTLIDDKVLHTLFDPYELSHGVFPLGANLIDVIAARHGWPRLGGAGTSKINSGCSDVPDPWTVGGSKGVISGSHATLAAAAVTGTSDTAVFASPAPAPSAKKTTQRNQPERDRPNQLHALGIDLGVNVELSRDTAGELVALIRTTNYGLTAAEEVEIVSAKLGGREPIGRLSTHRRHIDAGETTSTQLRFVGVPGKAGKQVTLKLGHSHLDGDYSTTLQLTLPTEDAADCGC